MLNNLKSTTITKYRKIALILSLCLIIAWAFLGTGTSIAWFTDTTHELNNIFHFGEYELKVYERLEDGTWDTEPIDSTTKIFDDEALYEPGYTQVVYLKVVNSGAQAFNFKTAVTVTDYTIAKNVFGQEFNLQDYLKFGVSTYFNVDEMDSALSERDDAVKLATTDLGNYSTDSAKLDAGGAAYVAIVIHMPEYVANEANYRIFEISDNIPKVELGVIVTADQIAE